MISSEEARARVIRGAAHLDTVRPGWFNRIDTGTLTMACGGRCIVGQLERRSERLFSFTAGCVALGFDALEAPNFGVDLTPDEWWRYGRKTTKEFERVWQPLQDAWIEAIADRRLAQPAIDRAVSVLVSA